MFIFFCNINMNSIYIQMMEFRAGGTVQQAHVRAGPQGRADGLAKGAGSKQASNQKKCWSILVLLCTSIRYQFLVAMPTL